MPLDQLDKNAPLDAENNHDLSDFNRYHANTPRNAHDPEESLLEGMDEPDFVPTEDRVGFGQNISDTIRDQIDSISQKKAQKQAVNTPDQAQQSTDSSVQKIQDRRLGAANRGVPQSSLDTQVHHALPASQSRGQKLGNALNTAQQIHEQGVGGYAKNAAVQKSKDQIKKVALREGGKLAARFGIKAIAGAFTGGTGAVIAEVAMRALDKVANAFKKFNTPQNRQRILYLQVAIILGLLTLPFMFAPAQRGRVSHNGPNPEGGTLIRPVSEGFLPAVAAKNGGLAASTSLEDLDASRTRMTQLIAKGTIKLSESQKQKANQLIAEMHTIREEMHVISGSAKNELMAQKNSEYRTKMNELFNIIYPDSVAARSRVVSLIDSGSISFAKNVCAQAENDIRNGNLTASLYSTLAEAGQFAQANGFSIIITCAKTGHRKFSSSGNVSRHFTGQGLDIGASPNSTSANKLLPFLFENRDKFALRELIFNGPAAGKPAGFYNIGGGKPMGRVFAGDHTNHIHMSVSK